MKSSDFANKLASALRSALTTVTNRTSLKLLGELGAKLIKDRTRNGYGVYKDGGLKTKLKQLSPKYKEQRKKKRPTGPTSPNKSNLTNSGDMLDAVAPIGYKTGSVTIGLSDTESKNKAEHVSKDRPFMNLSKEEQETITKQIERITAQAIENALKSLK